MKSLRFLSIFTLLLLTSTIKADNDAVDSNLSTEELQNVDLSEKSDDANESNRQEEINKTDVVIATNLDSNLQYNLATLITYAQNNIPTIPSISSITSLWQSNTKTPEVEVKIANTLTNNDSFEILAPWICTLENKLSEKTTSSQDHTYFEKIEDEIAQLKTALEKVKENALNKVTAEEMDAIITHENELKTFKASVTTRLTSAEKSYQTKFAAHTANLKKLTAEEQDTAVHAFKYEILAKYNTEVNFLNHELIEKETQLLNKLAIKKAQLREQRTNIESDYAISIKAFNTMDSIFHVQRKQAHINIQLNHNEYCKTLEFDETYSTKQEPNLWNGLTNYTQPVSYRANEIVMECHGCITSNYNVNNPFPTMTSNLAWQDVLMTASDMKYAKSQDGEKQVVGIKECVKTGANLRCVTIKEELEKAVAARNAKYADTDTPSTTFEDKTN